MLSKIIQLKSSLYSEIDSHIRLLSIDKNRFQEYFSSPPRIILIIIFTILFFPHVFVVVNNINFIIAYETDPGSIIQAILSLYKNYYNMNMGYHSQFYGWTYYSINFFLLFPIYIAKLLKIVTTDYFFFVGIRFIFFMIGLASVLAYFEVSKRILKNTFLSFAAALLYIASPAVFPYFYFLHPESTGLFFLFLGILCLLNFNDGRAENYRWYTLGLIALVLSALSKHFFFITALPVLFLFCYLYCHHHNLSILKFVFSRQFVRILFSTTLLSLFVFFIVNPFAFIQLKLFITNQTLLFTTMSQGSLLNREATIQWLDIIKTVPIIYISIILLPITLLGASIFGRDHKVGKMFYVVSSIVSLFYISIVSGSMRYVIDVMYFSHIYPFFVINLISVPLFIVRRWNINTVKALVMIPLVYFLFFVLVTDFSVTLPKSYTRLMYKDSLIFKVYSYVENTIPSGSKVANDHFVAIPPGIGIIDCDYWAGGCGREYIEEFMPDYVIFAEDWEFNGEKVPGTLRLEKYINDHDFILIDTIVGDTPVGNLSVSVWKKPDP